MQAVLYLFMNLQKRLARCSVCKEAIYTDYVPWILVQNILLFQGKNLRFHGGKLKVVEAAEPSNILWENADVGHTQKCARVTVITLLALAFLLIAGAINVLMTSEKTILMEEMANTTEYVHFSDDMLWTNPNTNVTNVYAADSGFTYNSGNDFLDSDDGVVIKFETTAAESHPFEPYGGRIVFSVLTFVFVQWYF